MIIYPRKASRSMLNPAPVISPRNVPPAVLAALKAALISRANPMPVIHPQHGFGNAINSGNNPMPVISPQNAPVNDIRSASNPMPVISPQGAGRPVFDIGPGGALLERGQGGNWYRASWGPNHQNEQAPQNAGAMQGGNYSGTPGPPQIAPQNQGSSPVNSGGPPLFPKPPFEAPQNSWRGATNTSGQNDPWGNGGTSAVPPGVWGGAPTHQGPQNQNLQALRQAFVNQMLQRMNNHFTYHSNNRPV